MIKMDLLFWLLNVMFILGAVAKNYTSPSGTLRLIEVVEVGNVIKGKVEVLLRKRWKPICASFEWDFKDTNVVCRELGYSGSIPLIVRTPKFQSNHVHHKRYDCNGTEKFLSICPRTDDSELNDCFIKGEAGVVCVTSSCKDSSSTKHPTVTVSTKEITSEEQENLASNLNIALGAIIGLLLVILLATNSVLIVICITRLKRKDNKHRNPAGSETHSERELDREQSQEHHNEPPYAVLEDNTSLETRHTYEDISYQVYQRTESDYSHLRQ